MARVKGKRFEDTAENRTKRESLFEQTFSIEPVAADETRAIQDLDWEMYNVPLEKLEPYSKNKRFTMNKVGIERLARNIRTIGLLEPIQAIKISGEEKYLIVAGHRRLEAYKLNNELYPNEGYDVIPTRLLSSSLSDDPETIYDMWQSSNLYSRHLNNEEILMNVDFYIKNLDTIDNEEKCKIVFELRNADEINKYKQNPDTFEENYQKNYEEFKKKYATLKGKQKEFNKAEYVRLQLADADIEMSSTAIKQYFNIIDNAIDMVKQAYIDKELPKIIANEISLLPKELQQEYFDLYNRNYQEYKQAISERTKKKIKTENAVIKSIKKSSVMLQRFITKGLINKGELDEIEKQISEIQNKLSKLHEMLDSEN